MSDPQSSQSGSVWDSTTLISKEKIRIFEFWGSCKKSSGIFRILKILIIHVKKFWKVSFDTRCQISVVWLSKQSMDKPQLICCIIRLNNLLRSRFRLGTRSISYFWLYFVFAVVVNSQVSRWEWIAKIIWSFLAECCHREPRLLRLKVPGMQFFVWVVLLKCTLLTKYPPLSHNDSCPLTILVIYNTKIYINIILNISLSNLCDHLLCHKHWFVVFYRSG